MVSEHVILRMIKNSLFHIFMLRYVFTILN